MNIDNKQLHDEFVACEAAYPNVLKQIRSSFKATERSLYDRMNDALKECEHLKEENDRMKEELHPYTIWPTFKVSDPGSNQTIDITKFSEHTGHTYFGEISVEFRLPHLFHTHDGGYYYIAETWYNEEQAINHLTSTPKEPKQDLDFGEDQSYRTYTVFRMVKNDDYDPNDDNSVEYDNYEDCMGQQVQAVFMLRFGECGEERVRQYLDTYCRNWVEV